VADRYDHSRGLEDRQEPTRQYQPLIAVAPAQQRLDRHDLTRREIDLRLIVQYELSLIERDMELVLERHSLARLAAHFQPVLQRVLAGFLGPLQSRLGTLHQDGSGRPVLG